MPFELIIVFPEKHGSPQIAVLPLWNILFYGCGVIEVILDYIVEKHGSQPY
jgi:hypothetical protein